MLPDAGLRRGEAAAQVWDDAARWDDGSGRLCLGRWKTDAEARTVYLTPAAAAGLGSGFSGHSGRVDMARRMAAGKRRGWWRSIGARRRRGEPRSGWRRSVAAFMDCPPATLSAADGPPRAARRGVGLKTPARALATALGATTLLPDAFFQRALLSRWQEPRSTW